jgi:hypothetical protein
MDLRLTGKVAANAVGSTYSIDSGWLNVTT